MLATLIALDIRGAEAIRRSPELWPTAEDAVRTRDMIRFQADAAEAAEAAEGLRQHPLVRPWAPRDIPEAGGRWLQILRAAEEAAEPVRPAETQT